MKIFIYRCLSNFKSFCAQVWKASKEGFKNWNSLFQKARFVLSNLLWKNLEREMANYRASGILKITILRIWVRQWLVSKFKIRKTSVKSQVGKFKWEKSHFSHTWLVCDTHFNSTFSKPISWEYRNTEKVFESFGV